MRIALVGYGKMGKLIAQQVIERGHQVAWIVDPMVSSAYTHFSDLSQGEKEECDVVIDFAAPQGALERLRFYGTRGYRVIMGTTGWYDSLKEAESFFSRGGACLWSGNFSLGVHLFFAALRKIAPLMNEFDDYDPFVHEYHHKYKADSPSGTAHMIGTILLEGLARKERVVTQELQRPIAPEELHISSTRGGAVPGTHTVTFDSAVDTLEFTHRARSREGFAKGSVIAAEWIQEKQGFFHIDDMLSHLQ